MRAIQIRELTGPSAVQVVSIPEPTQAPDHVLVDVRVCGVIFPDALLTRGLYQYRPSLPFIAGAEFGGVVRSAPEGAGFSEGDQVVGLTGIGGAMAETVSLAPQQIFALPEGLTLAQGCAMLTNDMTALFALRDRGRLANGENVLVHGAGGGLGTSLLRVAEALGAARRIAVVSSAEKGRAAEMAGATDVVLVEDWLASVRGLDLAVDVVADPVGGDRFTDSLRSLAPGGRVVVLGFAGGSIPEVKVNRLLLNNTEVIGAAWGEWAFRRPGYLAEQWEALGSFASGGALRPATVRTFPFEQAAEAIASLENRSAIGKIVLTVR